MAELEKNIFCDASVEGGGPGALDGDATEVPGYLSARSRELWGYYAEHYQFERHQLEILTDALRARDRAWQAKQQLDAEGLTIQDRFGKPKKHPCVDIEKEYIKLHSNLMMSLGLDYEPLHDRPGRPPRNAQMSLFESL